MGLSILVKVMLSAPMACLVLSLCWSSAGASICRAGAEYHDAQLQRCVACSSCADGEVVVRPCELHRDTQCAVLTVADLFELIAPDSEPSQERHRRRHRGHRRHENERVAWGVTEETVASTEAPFTGVETLVWDWQAVALSGAVFTCVLFFFVITLYSLHQARQWRRLKENFEHDVDELSASLMAAASAADAEAGKGKGIDVTSEITEANYLNRCVYLEQLLKGRKDREENRTNNVYIDGNSQK